MKFFHIEIKVWKSCWGSLNDFKICDFFNRFLHFNFDFSQLYLVFIKIWDCKCDMTPRLKYMYSLKPKDDSGYLKKCCMVPRVEKMDKELVLLQIEKAFIFWLITRFQILKSFKLPQHDFQTFLPMWKKFTKKYRNNTRKSALEPDCPVIFNAISSILIRHIPKNIFPFFKEGG